MPSACPLSARMRHSPLASMASRLSRPLLSVELPLIASTTLVMKTALTMIQVKLTSDVA